MQFDLVNETHTEITKIYSFKQEVGTGSFGKVSRAIHKNTGIERAIKVLSKKHMSEA